MTNKVKSADLSLPPLRALQAFEAFGRTGSVNGAAQSLNVSPGAVSQQLKALEDFVGMTLILKDGRRAVLTPEAEAYHALVEQGFEKLAAAQAYLAQQKEGSDLIISGLPTVLLKWLNPLLHRFQPSSGDGAIKLEATHNEPDPDLPGQMFRLTYGAVSQNFPHSRPLFTDRCFPVCSPEYLERYPQARDPVELAGLPLIGIDWGASYPTVPGWEDWFAASGITPGEIKPIEVHSLSGLALESAVAGKGAVLAQASFAKLDLELGRLIRLSDDDLPMPEPYYACWGQRMAERPISKEFLDWLLVEARAFG